MRTSRLLLAVALLLGFGPSRGNSQEIRGRVVGVSDNAVSIAVRADQKPAIGDKVEVYIELPDLDGVAVLATGRVTELQGSTVVAALEAKNGRIEKNQLARLVATQNQSVTSKPTPGSNSTEPSTRPPAPSPIDRRPSVAVDGPSSAPLDKNQLITLPEVLPKEAPLPNAVPQNPGPQGGGAGRPDDFTNQVVSYQRSVMFVGDPDRQAHGTGFVISRGHRLVATNAHVADISKIAVLNESRNAYKVMKKWYHPGVVRLMDDGRTKILSADPLDGQVWAECADIAILQLEGNGPDLPAEAMLASPLDAQRILGASVGMIGYPGYQRDQLFKSDLYASATFVRGTISRMTGLGHNPDAALDRRHLVHFDSNSYKGFSGSPVFGVNGQVVVVNNHIHLHDGHSEGSNLAYGIRIDALWELIEHANLGDLFPDYKYARPQFTAVNLPPDSRVEKLRSVQKLIDHSEDRIKHDDFPGATRAVAEAIEILPEYWRAYWQKSKNIKHYLSDEWEEIDARNKIRLVRDSVDSLDRASQLYSQSFGRANVQITLDRARDLITLGRVSGNRADYESALQTLGRDEVKSSLQERDYVLALRSSIKADINELAGALEDINEAIRLNSESPDYYQARADVWQKLGQRNEAARDLKRYYEMRERAHHHFEHSHDRK